MLDVEVMHARPPIKIHVSPYDSAWPAQFLLLKLHLETVLKDVNIVDIQHVGGTSVPGLAARPVIDIDIIVARSNVIAAIEALEAVGYKNLGQCNIVDRWVIQYCSKAGLQRSIFVVVERCLASRNHLAVRDMLRRHERLRDEYGERKLELAKNTWDGLEAYNDMKYQMVYKALEMSGWDGYHLREIRRINHRVTFG